MLRGQEEIMMLMKQRTMEGNQCLPLFVIELRVGISVGRLSIVNLNTLGLNHDKASVDSFHFGNELVLRDGSRLWLQHHIEPIWSILGVLGGLGLSS